MLADLDALNLNLPPEVTGLLIVTRWKMKEE